MTTVFQYFDYEHLRHDITREIAQQIYNLARYLEENITESPEKSVGMRKLLEAKDCFVRSVLETGEKSG